jgi:hypothetical protein
MPSILHSNEKVSFIVRKGFVLNGKKYTTGEDIPEINDHPKLEVFVRNGYVIPVVDEENGLPFQFRHTVMTRELAYHKLKVGNPRGVAGTEVRADLAKEPEKEEFEATPVDPTQTEETADDADSVEFNPADHNIDEVVGYCECAETEDVLDIYTLEEGQKNRPNLLKKLDTILNDRLEEEKPNE